MLHVKREVTFQILPESIDLKSFSERNRYLNCLIMSL